MGYKIKVWNILERLFDTLMLLFSIFGKLLDLDVMILPRLSHAGLDLWITNWTCLSWQKSDHVQKETIIDFWRHCPERIYHRRPYAIKTQKNAKMLLVLWVSWVVYSWHKSGRAESIYRDEKSCFQYLSSRLEKLESVVVFSQRRKT